MKNIKARIKKIEKELTKDWFEVKGNKFIVRGDHALIDDLQTADLYRNMDRDVRSIDWNGKTVYFIKLEKGEFGSSGEYNGYKKYNL